MTTNTPAAWDERAAEPTPWRVALWSERGQTQRFLAALCHLDLRDGDSLLDYGCGPGRFAAFLPSTVCHYGLDWSPAMRARARREQERAVIFDRLPDERLFDHVVCIGCFNLADNWSHEQTWATLRLLWEQHTRRTLLVSLYRRSRERREGMLGHLPAQLVTFAERLGCRRFEIDGTYLDNDLMLVLHR